MDNPTLEIIANDSNRCGEGPIWEPSRRRLLWTDIPADTVYEFTPSTNTKRILVRGINVSTIALARGGGLIFGGSGGLTAWSESAGPRPIVSHHDGLPLLINDMIATAAGGLYFGTVYWGASGMDRAGKLYHLSPDGVLAIADEGIELANGLAFGPDGRALYFADSATRRIYAYDADQATGALSNKRVLLQLSKDDGLPDGLTADAAGHVWTALWYTGQVLRITPGGRIDRRIQLPCLQASSLAFGGEEYAELYVTSAGEAWSSELAPVGYRAEAENQGGALYRIGAGAGGKAEFLASIEPRA